MLILFEPCASAHHRQNPYTKCVSSRRIRPGFAIDRPDYPTSIPTPTKKFKGSKRVDAAGVICWAATSAQVGQQLEACLNAFPGTEADGPITGSDPSEIRYLA